MIDCMYSGFSSFPLVSKVLNMHIYHTKVIYEDFTGFPTN